MPMATRLSSVVRSLLRKPRFSMLVIGTLSIGIAAATAVFSLVNGTIFRPLDFPQSERLAELKVLSSQATNVSPVSISDYSSWPDFNDWRVQTQSFESLAAFHNDSTNLVTESSARRVNGLIASANFLHTLRVQPVLGRDFLEAEDEAGNRSIQLSYALAQTLYGTATRAVGQVVSLRGDRYNVVGVLPTWFRIPGLVDVDYLLTGAIDREGPRPIASQRGYILLRVIGRLKDRVGYPQAQADLQLIQKGIATRFADIESGKDRVDLTSLSTYVSQGIRRPMLILLGAVLFLLVIACTNVSGLMLTEVHHRRSEMAIRAALGASRHSIVGQILTEALLLSVISAILGFTSAWVLLRFGAHLLPKALPRANEVSIDTRVVFFCIAASLLTGILFAVLPALRASGAQPAASLGNASRGVLTSREHYKLQGLLVVLETAVGLVLLIGAGLLIQSFERSVHSDPGFGLDHMLTFRIGVPQKGMSSAQQLALFHEIQRQVGALPGVQSVTYGFPQPLTGGEATANFELEGKPVSESFLPHARFSAVAANYFATMHIPMVAGRSFAESEDQPDGRNVVIINEAFARTFFPEGSALGKHITSAIYSEESKPGPSEIVGVVRNVSRSTVTEEPSPEFFLPYSHVTHFPPPFALRSAGDSQNYANEVVKTINRVNASFPVYRIATYGELLDNATALQRFQALLLSFFATTALLLSSIGLFAVLSYMVGQRKIELGLRMALGAKREQIVFLVMSHGLRLTLFGLSIGLAGAILMSRLLAGLLYKTRALDPTTFILTALILFCTALLASVLPAWRASRVAPMDCLRQQ